MAPLVVPMAGKIIFGVLLYGPNRIPCSPVDFGGRFCEHGVNSANEKAEPTEG